MLFRCDSHNKVDELQVYSFVTSHVLTMLYKRYFCFVPKHFYHSRRKPWIHEAETLISPSPTPGAWYLQT